MNRLRAQRQICVAMQCLFRLWCDDEHHLRDLASGSTEHLDWYMGQSVVAEAFCNI